MTGAGLLVSCGRPLHPEPSSHSSPSALTVDTLPVRRKDSLVREWVALLTATL